MFNKDSTLSSKVPDIDVNDAKLIALNLYGVRCNVQLLTAERDKNFLLVLDDDRKLVLKASNSSEDRRVTNLQTSALIHLEKTSPLLSVPRIVKTLGGLDEASIELKDGRTSLVRMLTYIPGVPLSSLSRSALVRRNLAWLLADLDIGLASFSHDAQGHELLWDITHLSRLEKLMGCVDGKDLRRLVERTIDDFKISVEPAISSLRTQVIYNDLNFYNVLMSPAENGDIAGLVDFGDIICAPLVNDVSIAAAYHFQDSAEPFSTVGEFIGAYHARLSLLPDEVALIPSLIASRMATTVLITSWRAKTHPDNEKYILRNSPVAQAGLSLLAGRSKDQNLGWINSVCGDRTQ